MILHRKRLVLPHRPPPTTTLDSSLPPGDSKHKGCQSHMPAYKVPSETLDSGTMDVFNSSSMVGVTRQKQDACYKSIEGHNQIAHQELVVVDSQPTSFLPQPLLVGDPHGKSPDNNPHVVSGQVLPTSASPHIGIVLSFNEANCSRVSVMPIAISEHICTTFGFCFPTFHWNVGPKTVCLKSAMLLENILDLMILLYPCLSWSYQEYMLETPSTKDVSTSGMLKDTPDSLVTSPPVETGPKPLGNHIPQLVGVVFGSSTSIKRGKRLKSPQQGPAL
uniref:Uncharacterized protein n=1 Tax=Populus alba TaxID=43335 RepID=A0A4U5NQC6_POPAL|nr:hypothetical protein D5086_0000250550 [Populus alba]